MTGKNVKKILFFTKIKQERGPAWPHGGKKKNTKREVAMKQVNHFLYGALPCTATTTERREKGPGVGDRGGRGKTPEVEGRRPES